MALTDNLVAYWKMDESSGVRYDSTDNNNDLTDNNTVGSATGIISNGADFERDNSEYLSITDANQTGLDLTSTFSFSFWVKVESAPTSGNIYVFLSKDGAQRGYSFFYENNSGTMRTALFIPFNTTPTAYALLYHNVTFTAGNWYHVVITCNLALSGVNRAVLYINGSSEGAADSEYTVSTQGSTMQNNNAAVTVGRRDVATDGYIDGILDEVGIWSSVLSSSDVTSLYNSGSGLSYPFSGGSTGYIHSQACLIC